ncbi:MAG: hypothetical protein ACR2QM_02180 [Longimicrobiales bacterium]
MDLIGPRVGRGVALGGVFALALAACGDDTPTQVTDPDFTGSFTATITGAASATITGVAIFASGTDPVTSEASWVVYLATNPQNPGASTEAIYFTGPGSPSAQSYNIADLNEDPDVPAGGAGAFVIATPGTTPAFFLSDGGSLQITSLDATRMDGTFNIDATGLIIEPGGMAMQGTVNVQGSFEAEGGAFILPPG